MTEEKIRVEYKGKYAEINFDDEISRSYEKGERSGEVELLISVLSAARSIAEYGYYNKTTDIEEMKKGKECFLNRKRRWIEHIEQPVEIFDKLLSEVLPKLVRVHPNKEYHTEYSVY